MCRLICLMTPHQRQKHTTQMIFFVLIKRPIQKNDYGNKIGKIILITHKIKLIRFSKNKNHIIKSMMLNTWMFFEGDRD